MAFFRLRFWGDMSGRKWADLEDDFALYLSITFESSDTRRNYFNRAKAFGLEVESLSRVKHQDVERWYAALVEESAQNTATAYLCAVRCFFRWYKERGGIKMDPTERIKMRPSTVDPTRAFTEHDLRRLLRAAETVQERAFLLVFIHSAARKSEGLAMKAEHIDWERGEILIKRGKGAKTRILSPGPATMEALTLTLAGRKHGPVWLSQMRTPMARSTADAYLWRIAERAGVIAASFHRFRTAFGERFIDMDGSVDELMVIYGHSSPATTMHYIKRTRKTRALRSQRLLAERFELAG